MDKLANLATLLMFYCLNRSQRPTFKMDKHCGFGGFFFLLDILQRMSCNLVMSNSICIHLSTSSRFHVGDPSQGGKFSHSRNSTYNEESLFPRTLSHTVSVSECLSSSFVFFSFTDAY